MNFLAHAYLSGDDPEVMVGNFIGDFIKGKKYGVLPQGLQKGVLLHRAIDEYTDSHNIVGESKNRLRQKYRHYAGVIVDVIYDHLLATNWQNYNTKSLLDFTTGLYERIDAHRSILPDRFNYVFDYMKRDNWLYHYAHIDGIDRALSGMARRTKFDSKMDEAVIDLKKHYSEFTDEFQEFFPDIEAFVKDWLNGF